MNKQEFLERFNMSESQFYGKREIGVHFSTAELTKVPDGFNPWTRGYLDMGFVTELPDNFSPVVEGDLYLGMLKKTPDGFNPKVQYSIHLDSIKELPDGFNLKVGKSMHLDRLETIPRKFSPVTGGGLSLGSVKKIPSDFSPIVGGVLGLSGLSECPENFKMCAGAINLWSVRKLPKGFSPTVLEDLRLKSLRELPEDFSPTVGRDILFEDLESPVSGCNFSVGRDLLISRSGKVPEGFSPYGHVPDKHSGRKSINAKTPKAIFWGNEYMAFGRYFCEIIERRTKEVGGEQVDLFFVNRPTRDIQFFVASKQGEYAPGLTLDTALEHLSEQIVNDKSDRCLEIHRQCWNVIYPDAYKPYHNLVVNHDYLSIFAIH